MKNMTRILVGSCIITLLCGCAGSSSPNLSNQSTLINIDPLQADRTDVTTEKVRQDLNHIGEGEFLSVIVRLAGKANIESSAPDSERTKKQTRAAVIAHLQNYAETSQAELTRVLADLEMSDLARNIQPLWLANVVSVDATAEAIDHLAVFPGVETIFSRHRSTVVPGRNVVGCQAHQYTGCVEPNRRGRDRRWCCRSSAR